MTDGGEGAGVTELVEVRIVDMPLAVYREASEHSDELMREFTLIRERESEDGRAVPRRLLELVNQLTSQYGTFTAPQQTELQEALERGDPTITLVYRVPPRVGQACIDLDHLLDEADRYCREGQELLTLTTPAQALAFRKWFLVEFVRQIGGAEPMTWDEFRATTS